LFVNKLERGMRDMTLGVERLRAHLGLIGGDVANWINPIFGRLNPSFDTGILGEQVQQVCAAQELERLPSGKVE
jgi:hypothetical protein